MSDTGDNDSDMSSIALIGYKTKPEEEELHVMELEGLGSSLDANEGEIFYDVGGILNHQFNAKGPPEVHVEWLTGP